MVVKVYISGICGSQDVRKQQQRVLFILSTLPLDLEIIDITEPGREEERSSMQEEAKKHNKKVFLPPQIFHDNEYCGDYDDFQLAADDDVLMTFLKLEEPSGKNVSNGHVEEPAITQNGISNANEKATEQDELQTSTDDVKEDPLLDTGEEIISKLEDTVINDVSHSDLNAESTPEVPKSEENKVEEKESSEEEEESEEEESE